MAADKAQVAQALANTVVDGVAKAVAPHFAGLNAQMAKLAVQVSALEARLALMESAAGGAPAGKRGLRPASAGKKPAAAGKKGNITNSLLYFKAVIGGTVADDFGIRDSYCEEHPQYDAAAGDPSVAKIDPEKETQKFWTAYAGALWKLLSEDAKSGIKANYGAYKEGIERNNADPPLDEDGAAEDA